MGNCVVQPLDPGEVNLRYYAQRELLGRGRYGEVYKYTRREGAGKDVGPRNIAVKKLIKGENELKQCEIAGTLSHKNIIAVFGVSKNKHNIFLLMELARVNLEQFADEWKQFINMEVTEIAIQVASGLGYLHINDIAHRNMKPQNIVLSWKAKTDPFSSMSLSDVTVKLCDLDVNMERKVTIGTGLEHKYDACLAVDSNGSFSGRRGYGKAVDVFSLGVVLIELRLHERLRCSAQREILDALDDIPLENSETEENCLRLIVSEMVSRTPMKIPSAGDVLRRLKRLPSGSDITSIGKKHNAFHLACFLGKLDRARHLLQNGYDVEEADEYGLRPLHLVCIEGNSQIADFLLENGADVESKNNAGYTALILACRYGHTDTARTLLKFGADIDLMCEGDLPISIAVKFDHTATVRMLLDHGADINKADAEYGLTPLHYQSCARAQHLFSDLNTYLRRLLKHGAAVNQASFGGLTPLHFASSEDLTLNMQELLQFGAANDQAMANGMTPLHKACESGQTEAARLLMRRGADISRQTWDGRNPVHVACQHGKTETAAMLMLEQGVSVEAESSYGATPLFFACANGKAETAAMLLERGANLEGAKDVGTNPFQVAAMEEELEIVGLLLEEAKSKKLTACY